MSSSALARIAELRQQAGDVLTPLGVAEMPETPQVFVTDPCAPFDWLLLRLDEDPAYKRGELAIPTAQRAVLRDLDRRGVRFDELLVAHEVRKGAAGQLAAMGHKLPDTYFAPAAQPLMPSAPALKALTALIDGLAVGGKILGAAALSPLLLAAVADPILIGAVVAGEEPTGRTLAAFFEIIRWDSVIR